MISMRRLYFSRYNGSPRKAPIIASPWARTKSHGTNAPLTRISNNSSPNTIKSPRRPLERVAIAIMLLIAWAWIMVFFGMIFYHGYQYRTSNGGAGAGDATVRMEAKTRLPSLQLQEETDKHQESPRIEQTSATTVTTIPKLEPHGSPLLVFTCQRASYLSETLTDILKFIPSDCSMGCPVVVSQDGNDAEVTRVISEFQTKFLERKGLSLIHLEHKSALRRGVKSTNSYQALAIHYGWALRQVFDGNAAASKTARLPQRVLILEEDLHIAPDFFEYFSAMAPVLDADFSLLAVSAFNDNGFQDTVRDNKRVLRSDFFPGLGWMMTRKLWTNELQLKWPNGYWDDWLREPAQRQGRQMLRPEVSRTFHFGVAGGASNNQFGSKLNKVWLNNEKVDWKQRPEDDNKDHWSYYLRNKETYDILYWDLLKRAQLEMTVQEALEKARDMDVRLEYDSLEQFQKMARELKPPLMDDEKAGIPRTAYKGVVETRPHGDHFLFLTPPMADLQNSFVSVAGDGESIAEATKR